MDLYGAYKDEPPNTGCDRSESNGPGPVDIYSFEFPQRIASRLSHHVDASRQVHNDGRAGERISQFRIRAQISQMGNLV